ncbi:MAG TPA: hypothetical protein VEF55_03210 [Candidatus Binatia bacterium]|nr:hypothetical protein [Candidatus Binatia bacterium]
MSRSRHQTGAPRARRYAFALAALFAVLLQAFVVQTHIHAPVAPIGAAIERVADGSDALIAIVSAPDEHQAFACVICQTLASAGSAVLTAPVSGLAASEAISEAATYALPRAPPIAAHPWQSRGPPIVLQA